MIIGDSAYIKKINRGIILREIMKQQAISRADLAKITGLNKATVSVQVADLLKEKLIKETKTEHHSVGRRPIMLSMKEKTGFVLGIDLDYDEIYFTIANLKGEPIETKCTLPPSEIYEDVIHHVRNEIKNFQEKYKNSHYGLIGVTIGIHGTVNKDEQVMFVPKYNWQKKNMKEDLALDSLPIIIENNANLSAFAEKVYQFHETDHLLAINLTSGIGAGIMIHGKIHQGFEGYAGEMGHMITVPQGKKCRCGNKGCWELYASETSFLSYVKEQEGKAFSRAEIVERLQQREEKMMKYFDDFLSHLSLGLNNVINIFNPDTLVLTSEFLKAYPEAIQEIQTYLTSSVSHYQKIVISELGSQSCVLGACAYMIQEFLKVPELVIPFKTS